MWLLTTEGAYSAIRWHDGRMCVRGRRKVDLQRLRKIVPALGEVQTTIGKDYRYRCFCTVDEWADGMAALARTIDYGNFKSEVLRKRGRKDKYEHYLHSIWSILAKLQPGGPYGYTTNKPGYPDIPKGERKLKAPPSRWPMSLMSSPQQRAGQLRIRTAKPDEGDEGLVCEECDEILAPEEAIVSGLTVLCRDVDACMDRAGVLR